MINKTSKLNTRILIYLIIGIVLCFFSVVPATALIISAPGNYPVNDGGITPGGSFPIGTVKLLNLPTRIGYGEGPFEGGEYHFLYKCQKTEQFNEALKTFAAIIAPFHELLVYDGPKYNQLMDNAQVDWTFTVWSLRDNNWNETYKRTVNPLPRLFPSTIFNHFTHSPPKIDVYIGDGSIVWEEVKVPKNVYVADMRTASVVKQTGAVENTPVEFKKNKEVTVGIDYSGVSPKELLDILKDKVAEHQAFMGGMASKNWITKEDVKYLMTLINSQEPCLPVVSPITSDLYSDIKSTVGKEALFLIEGYRLGRYPPIVSSVCFKPDIEGIKTWWVKQDGETFASLGLPEGASLIEKKPNPATLSLKTGETVEVYFYQYYLPDSVAYSGLGYGMACFERDPDTKKPMKTVERNYSSSNPMKEGYLKDVDKDGTEEIVIECYRRKMGAPSVPEIYTYKYLSGDLYLLLPDGKVIDSEKGKR